MPQAPAPDLQARCCRRCQALAGGGSFTGKAAYIQGGIGRIEGIAADRAYNDAAAKGNFPLTFDIANIDQDGRRGHRRRHRDGAYGEAPPRQSVQFVAGPSPTGWQIAKASALTLLSAAG